MTIDELNRLSAEDAAEHFFRCCGCRAWASGMAGARPYRDLAGVHEKAESLWAMSSRADWLEAFTAHPRIGDVNSLRAKFANTKAWASGEQSGVDAAAEATLNALAAGNTEYEAKFGFIFIVCATGKSADQMLEILRGRLPNDAEREVRIAAGEQMKITHLRIDKWLQE